MPLSISVIFLAEKHRGYATVRQQMKHPTNAEIMSNDAETRDANGENSFSA